MKLCNRIIGIFLLLFAILFGSLLIYSGAYPLNIEELVLVIIGIILPLCAFYLSFKHSDKKWSFAITLAILICVVIGMYLVLTTVQYK